MLVADGASMWGRKTPNPHAAKARTRHAETTKAAGLVPRQLLSYIFSLYWEGGTYILESVIAAASQDAFSVFKTLEAS